MRKIREENDRNEERFRQLSNNVDKNKMADAVMAAELQSLQAGEERRGSNASQTGDCCLEEKITEVLRFGPKALWQQHVALGANGIEIFVKVPKVNGSGSRADARKRRRKKEQ